MRSPGTQILAQRLDDVTHDARPGPLLKPPMAGLVWRVALWKVSPGHARTQNIQNAVEHLPAISPRPAAAILAAFGIWDQSLQDFPLLIGHISMLRHGLSVFLSLGTQLGTTAWISFE
jgi:hypothetical protein